MSESTGLKPATLPEKPSFAKTCNLLSQYLKEKGSFGIGDISLGMTCSVETNGTPQVPPPTMNLFPVDNNKSGDVPKRVDCSTVTNMNKFEPQTAEMTIFYGGQVIVFNDFPGDKAKEIMLLASNSSSSFNPTPFTSSRARSPIESGIASKADQPAQQPLPSDLPIARRASLHRFLEKRKDRIASKAPYQITSSAHRLPSRG